ncbi:hypothetical protein D9758_012836 [Tetrapyrgos nigripes]|uniref:F-box domain-containing protein n=1 Tax=Tetrapyrgos nigripes TaxID=182062 RepID=A0A8H5CCZ3_9AGAR|nr:hypothetical protein D9758_012836 [Tetrapyrgos nigripes]
MIFTLVAPLEIEDAENNTNPFNPLLPSVSLASVCRGWHDVAYDSPQLWSVFDINFSSLSPGAIHVIDSCLTRSKNSPLSVHLHGELSVNRVIWQDVLTSLIRQSSRWKYFFFEVERSMSTSIKEYSASRNVLQKLMAGIEDLPALDSLRFESTFIDGISPLLARMSCRSPHLRSLTLHGELLPLDDELLEQSAGLSSLESLSVSGIPLHTFVDFLRGDAFRDLKSLVLQGLEIYEEDSDIIPDRQSLVTFQHLSSLSIYQTDGADMGVTLEFLAQMLQAPSLQTLDIKTGLIFGPVIIEPLHTFLTSTKCTTSLTTLHLEGVRDVALLLPLFPNLRTLSVSETHYSGRTLGDIIGALRLGGGRDGGHDLVPKLQHLELKAMRPDLSLFSSLAEMAKSRWNSGSTVDGAACLSKLSLEVSEGLIDRDTEGYRALEELKAAGLDVEYNLRKR